MIQTWWLSFCDPDKPTGQQFLGVAIVDVGEADMQRARPVADAVRAQHGLGPVDDDTAWMAAAIQQSHRARCNPGGEVGAVHIDDAPAFHEKDATLPRNRLLTRDELEDFGLETVSEADE